MALAIPTTFAGGGLPFGIAYLVVIALHSALFIRATSAAEARAMRGIAPYNLLVAALVLVAGAVGGDPQWALMAAAAAILWASALFISVEGFHVSATHFVERHGLLVIIALGESIVALGVGSVDARVGGGDALIAILGLALSTVLWWAYFRDERRIEEALVSTPARDRARVSLIVYGYLHFFLLFGIVLLTAGLKHAIPDPLESIGSTSAVLLAGGTAMFLAAGSAVLQGARDPPQPGGDRRGGRGARDHPDRLGDLAGRSGRGPRRGRRGRPRERRAAGRGLTARLTAEITGSTSYPADARCSVWSGPRSPHSG